MVDQPAFPCVGYGLSGDSYLQEGMTLRDWFAGQALAGIAARGMPAGHANGKDTATVCFALADAMLAARKEPGA